MSSKIRFQNPGKANVIVTGIDAGDSDFDLVNKKYVDSEIKALRKQGTGTGAGSNLTHVGNIPIDSDYLDITKRSPNTGEVWVVDKDKQEILKPSTGLDVSNETTQWKFKVSGTGDNTGVIPTGGEKEVEEIRLHGYANYYDSDQKQL